VYPITIKEPKRSGLEGMLNTILNAFPTDPKIEAKENNKIY